MNLRPREEQKEISRNFRFKPTITAERIAESVAINNGTKMPRSIMREKGGAIGQGLLVDGDHLSSSIGMLRPHQM